MTADLQRFVEAQDQGGVYVRALQELRAGQKRTHWIWFVFPQISGLGRSPTAQHFALASLQEAQAYLAHPVLGPRLRESVQALLEGAGTSTAREVLGDVDAMKLRSSLTLFAAAAPEEALFTRALERFAGGTPDPETTRRL